MTPQPFPKHECDADAEWVESWVADGFCAQSADEVPGADAGASDAPTTEAGQ